MAIRKTVVTPQGFEAVDAYHSITRLAIDRLEGAGLGVIVFNVVSKKDKFVDTPFSAVCVSCPYDISVQGGNPFKQAYSYLKGYGDFVGSQDD